MASTLPKFPLPYVFEVEKGIKYATQEVVFESGKKQVRQLSVNPKLSWSIKLRGTIDQQKIFEDFVRDVGGNTRTFIFTDEYNKDHVCRFATGEFNIKVLRDFTIEKGTHGNAVAFTANVDIEKVL